MPDTRSHRGSGPEDGRLFGWNQVPVLRSAVEDFSWLLSRGYAEKSALKLIGDRYKLQARQRLAVLRSSCSDRQLEGRLSRRIGADRLAGRRVLVDGFNLLITLESAMGGAYLFGGRDGCLRDLAGLHGTYRIVDETPGAIELLAKTLERLMAAEAIILLDRPVSNSGRLKQLIEPLAAENRWAWTVELHENPDRLLVQSRDPVITADSAVLDACAKWVNLTPVAVQGIESVRLINLRGAGLPRRDR